LSAKLRPEYYFGMNSNPYAPPSTSDDLAPLPDPELRAMAQRRFHRSCWILSFPALLNWVFFNWRLRPEYVLVNCLGLVVLAIVVAHYGFRIVERLSSTIQRIACRNDAWQEWDRVLWKALVALPGFIAIGSLLWTLWVIGFYVMDINFVLISYAVGIPAHVLAACFYVPLITNWFRIARASNR